MTWIIQYFFLKVKSHFGLSQKVFSVACCTGIFLLQYFLYVGFAIYRIHYVPQYNLLRNEQIETRAPHMKIPRLEKDFCAAF